MKALFFLLLTATQAANVLDPINHDFLTGKELLIVYADGTPKSLIVEKAPIIQSYRDGGFEVRNLCETINCDYHFTEADRYPNRFRSNKCYLLNAPLLCDSRYEREAVLTIEQIIHESDFAMSVDLDGETYAIIANSKTEDSMILLSEESFSVTLEHGSLGKIMKQ